MSHHIKVLVVDDSAFARKVVRESLEGEHGIEVVGIARDGLEALEKISELAPDVITLDLVMPNLDGVGVLHELAQREGAPRAVVVSIADGESELGVAALAAGATELVHKPTALATSRLYEIKDDLVQKVRSAAQARAMPSGRSSLAAETPHTSNKRLVAIGTSTGGPQAIAKLLAALPATFPVPIVVVIHLPPGYTEAYARRLDETCALSVVETADGMLLTPGMVAIARAGLHTMVVDVAGALVVRHAAEPSSAMHRPSVDVLFESIAPIAPAVVGVVLTGMGDDGTLGAKAIHARGGVVLVESERSCVVFGMPRSVKEAGAMTAEAPLSGMPALIAQHL